MWTNGHAVHGRSVPCTGVAVTVAVNYLYACECIDVKSTGTRRPGVDVSVARREAAGRRSPVPRSVAALLSDRHGLSLTVRASDGWFGFGGRARGAVGQERVREARP